MVLGCTYLHVVCMLAFFYGSKGGKSIVVCVLWLGTVPGEISDLSTCGQSTQEIFITKIMYIVHPDGSTCIDNQSRYIGSVSSCIHEY